MTDAHKLAEEVLELAQEATQEPWWVEDSNAGDPADHPSYIMAVDGEISLAAMFLRGIEGQVEADAKLITLFRTAAPILATAVLALEQRIKEIEGR